MKIINYDLTNTKLIRLPRRRAANPGPKLFPHRKIDLVAYAAALEILG